jgi:hypothetical protein
VTAGELGIVLVAVVVASIAKSVTGMGLPLIVIPIASLFVSVEDAVVVIALPNVLANVVLAGRERRSFPATRDLQLLVPFGIAGAVVGTLVFVSVPEEPIVALLVLAIVLYVALYLVHPDRTTTPTVSRRCSPLVGSTAGLFQGAIGISGPIVGAWIHSYRLPRGAHILSVTAIFALTGLTQLVVLIANGELAGRWLASTAACVPVLGSIPFGTWLRDRVSAAAFDRAIIAVLAVSAVALTLETFT